MKTNPALWSLEPAGRNNYHLKAGYSYFIDRSYGKFVVREWGTAHYNILRERGVVVRGGDYVHSYRICIQVVVV